tara:strand:+ start:2593 stop:3039 length:447 start_codon:yes stop_codon:yes gene_type:complete
MNDLLKGRKACDDCNYVVCVCKPVVGYHPRPKITDEDKSSSTVISLIDDDRIICGICNKQVNKHTDSQNKFCDNELKLINEQKDKPESYITVYKPIAGWKAVMMTPDEDGFVSPWTTSDFAFSTKEEAIKYAKDWAEAEEMKFQEGGI